MPATWSTARFTSPATLSKLATVRRVCCAALSIDWIAVLACCTRRGMLVRAGSSWAWMVRSAVCASCLVLLAASPISCSAALKAAWFSSLSTVFTRSVIWPTLLPARPPGRSVAPARWA
ncbi:hypothetical protein [Ottowia beijingensis]|uniref:hypothetical protein n=1 Tax=Ottowia beijingensis TaxID=1207057 RepID=UPI00214D76E4|nr:hypothetical protein [Ottowia beijingensis]